MKLRNRPEQRTATRHIHSAAAVAFPGIDIRGSSMIGNMLRAAFATALAATFTIGVLALPSAANTTEVSATGRPAAGDECTSDPQYGTDNAPAGVPPLLYFEGNLLGCYYVDEADTRVTAAGGGRFRLVEKGTETFIGTLDGEQVTFRTSYVFLAWFHGNPLEDPDAQQLSGGCHHPLIEGGHGVLHFVDDVENGLIHARGVINL